MPALDSEGKPLVVIMTPGKIRNAQIAFLNDDSWAVIGAYRRITASPDVRPMPAVDCPIIDTTGITNIELKRRIIRRHISPPGVDDIPALINKLLRIGGMLHNPSVAQKVESVTKFDE